MLDTIKKAVFFGAHTDDEMICAGTLHRLARMGCEVHVVTFGPAATKEDRCGSFPSVGVVVPEWHAALDLIGVGRECRRFHSMVPTSKLVGYAQEMCQHMFEFAERERPDAVFTLSPEDENPAHSVVGVQAERVMRGRVPYMIRCQFPWNYGLGRANLFVKLDPEELRIKAAVIDAYKSQHFRYEYKEMLMAQVRVDGLSVKVAAAEKFELIRGVI